MDKRALWAGAGLALVVAVWAVWPRDPGSDAGGVVRVGPVRDASPSVAQTASAVIAQDADPTGLATALRSETRDLLWASRSEAALAGPMGGFAFLAAPPAIRCAATLCEVRGTATAASTDAVKLAWQEIEQVMESDALSAAGLIAADKAFGARGDPYAFVIYYRREDSLLSPP
ncbi:hypothetical protein [Sphingomonas sp.]|uniref:hypothetical protein n=1 Tax=Sphingomonas sp. TaxID=28214 RepID=UPI003F6F00E3